MPALTLRNPSNSAVIPSGAAYIPDTRVGAGVDYWPLEIWADSVSSFNSGVVWLTVDTTGVAVAISVPDSVARAQSYLWPFTWSALTYTTPTTAAGGLSIPNLAPGNKTLVVLRRSPSGGSVATPERNTIRASGVWV